MRAIDGTSFLNIRMTPATFTLDGGTYGVVIVASTWGTATLQILAPNGITFLPVLAAMSANGTAVVQVPAGVYQLTLAGASGVYFLIRRIPGE